MKAAIDEIYFNEESFEVEVKGTQRSVIQRTAAGFDGQVSIDLGLRGRKLLQKGELRAKSGTELQRKIDEINELIDGELHTLKCPDGRVFKNLLIEEFQTKAFVNGGAHISCQYHITYTQQG